MSLSERDSVSFHDIAEERARDDSRLDASTLLYQAFWKREFDLLNQTPEGQTCMTFPIRSGGRDHFNPATRDLIFKWG